MKIRNEAEMEEQIQELKTITRLQGTPATRCLGAPGAGLLVLTQRQPRANWPGARPLLTHKQSWKDGWEGSAMGRGWRSWGLQRDL